MYVSRNAIGYLNVIENTVTIPKNIAITYYYWRVLNVIRSVVSRMPDKCNTFRLSDILKVCFQTIDEHICYLILINYLALHSQAFGRQIENISKHKNPEIIDIFKMSYPAKKYVEFFKKILCMYIIEINNW